MLEQNELSRAKMTVAFKQRNQKCQVLRVVLLGYTQLKKERKCMKGIE